MCISCSSHQADEVYTTVYTKIVILLKPNTNRTNIMLTYQEDGALPFATLVPHLYDNASLIWVIMRPPFG